MAVLTSRVTLPLRSMALANVFPLGWSLVKRSPPTPPAPLRVPLRSVPQVKVRRKLSLLPPERSARMFQPPSSWMKSNL